MRMLLPIALLFLTAATAHGQTAPWQDAAVYVLLTPGFRSDVPQG